MGLCHAVVPLAFSLSLSLPLRPGCEAQRRRSAAPPYGGGSRRREGCAGASSLPSRRHAGFSPRSAKFHVAGQARPLKLLHITEYCHAGSIGGTERYILDLVRGLASAGHRNSIGWLSGQGFGQSFAAEAIPVVRLPAPAMRVEAPLPDLAPAAARLLEEEQPDWVHFHTFGLSEALVARLARQRGIPCAFTFHSPAWTCRRGTMLLYGQKPCDGEVRPWRCSACQSAERLRLGRIGGHAAAFGSLALGWTALPLGRDTLRRRTAFYYDTLRYRSALTRFLVHCSLVISCCDWSTPVLLRNGARPESIKVCPQGVSEEFVSAATKAPLHDGQENKGSFTVGCLGRLDPVKGVHILASAFTTVKEPRARLRIVGWEPENAGAPYPRAIRELTRADARVTLVPKTNLSGAIAEYRRLSLLALPSVWMETGPLTLLEALALGVPVFGSNRIGQLSLLRERGRVVEPNTVAGWHRAIEEALGAHRSKTWAEEASRSRPHGGLRTMQTVTGEMIGHYQATSRRP